MATQPEGLCLGVTPSDRVEMTLADGRIISVWARPDQSVGGVRLVINAPHDIDITRPSARAKRSHAAATAPTRKDSHARDEGIASN